MLDDRLINKIICFKLEKGYTLHDLSRILNIQVTTIERWFKTKHINRVYAQLVRERLQIE